MKKRVLDFYRFIYVPEYIDYPSDLATEEFKYRLDRIFHKESAFPDKYNIKLEYTGPNEFIVEPIVEVAPIRIYNIYYISKVNCRGKLTDIEGNCHLSLTLSTSWASKLMVVLIAVIVLPAIILVATKSPDWRISLAVGPIAIIIITWFTYLAKAQCDEIKDGMNKAMVLLYKL